jgi:hypothetical protein
MTDGLFTNDKSAGWVRRNTMLGRGGAAGEVARGLHHLADGVLTECVDDGNVARCPLGALGELPRESLHVSSWVQC